MPKVSIMIPSYNHAKYVHEALESVMSQTLQDFEVIVSDDHSPDQTVTIIRNFNDPRISLHVFPQNVGATMNHEYCWKHCTSPYIALLNSDDVWLPEHLEKAVVYLDTHPSCGAVFSWCSYINEESKVIDPCGELFKQPNRTRGEWLRHFFTKGNCICHPSMVIRREVYDKIGFYSRSLRQLPDFNEWIRLVKHYDLHIIPEVLVQHRRCNTTMGNTSAPVIENSLRDVAESHYILTHFFDDVDDKLFKEAFGPLFRNPKAKNHQELMCERFFLLLDDHYYLSPLSKYAAFNYFQDIFSLPGMRELFLEQYHYSINDFFQLSHHLDYLGLRQIQAASAAAPTEPVPAAPIIPVVPGMQMIAVAGDINSRTNRFKALAWAIFGRNSAMYNSLQFIYTNRKKEKKA